MFLKERRNGMVALVTVMTILSIVTGITLFTARLIVTDNRIFNNVKNNADALNAAQAGLGYAIGYLNVNMNTVTTGLDSCSLAANTYSLTPGTLANNAIYTMTYGCTTAGNTSTISITATGTSADSSSTRTIVALVKSYTVVSGVPLYSKGATTLNNGTIVQNGNVGGIATTTIADGGAVSITGASKTVLNGVTASTAGNILSDVVQNNEALAGYSSATLQTTYLGKLISSYAASANITLTCDSSTTIDVVDNGACTAVPAGTVSGASDKIIYVDMTTGGTLTLGKQFTLTDGSTLVVHNAASVIGSGKVGIGNGVTISGALISDGPISFTGRSQDIFGLVFTTSNFSATGTGISIVNGAIVAGGTTIISSTGPSSLIYSPSDLSDFPGVTGGMGVTTIYGLVAGSWRDF